MFHGHPAQNPRLSMTQPGLSPTYNNLAPPPPVVAHSGTQASEPSPAFSKSIVLIS